MQKLYFHHFLISKKNQSFNSDNYLCHNFLINTN